MPSTCRPFVLLEKAIRDRVADLAQGSSVEFRSALASFLKFPRIESGGGRLECVVPPHPSPVSRETGHMPDRNIRNRRLARAGTGTHRIFRPIPPSTHTGGGNCQPASGSTLFLGQRAGQVTEFFEVTLVQSSGAAASGAAQSGAMDCWKRTFRVIRCARSARAQFSQRENCHLPAVSASALPNSPQSVDPNLPKRGR